ncbi:protein translocase subunit SecD [candidate division WOR-3 bacterium]|nr:protein translocase subunit SecD [candidate division WOR-3 bacterium]
MRPKIRVSAIIILVTLILAAWQLSYTWRYVKMSPEKKELIPKSALKKLRDKAIRLGLDLQGGMHIVLEVDVSKLTEDERKGARDRALEILRNRIDQFGVSEPSIAKQSANRIVIQLPGVVDRVRAKELIGRTAQLEFRLIEKGETTDEILKKIDELVYKKQLGEAEDTLEVFENPLLSLFYRRRIAERDITLFNEYLNIDGVSQIIPTDDELLWSKPAEIEGERYLEPLLVKKKVCLKGDAIVDARAAIGTPKNPVGSRVDLTMTTQARRKWARITGANVGRRIAIVLDGIVQSAPVVIERIAGGKSMIEMGASPFKEAQDLALIIRSGALPAPVKIVEERSVGPSLGIDSIKSGVRSMYIGGIAVLLFMIIYYAACGALADFILFFNILFLLAILSGFSATLTLPGIAGIVLVIGAGVDANVLIFERIREELAAGKTTRAAIDAGFRRAFRTIIDANVTTFLIAIILYYFGRGPIKGFGITLAIGITVNIFTAMVMTKLVLDFIASKGIKKISI